MKALTIRQPYASLIVAGVKALETRKWTTDYRGPLLIHASKAPPVITDALCAILEKHDLPKIYYLPRGAIVGMATLQAVYCKAQFDSDGDLSRMITQERDMGCFLPSWHSWWLTFPFRLKEPIKCLGALGLWTPPTSVLDQLKPFCQRAA